MGRTTSEFVGRVDRLAEAAVVLFQYAAGDVPGGDGPDHGADAGLELVFRRAGGHSLFGFGAWWRSPFTVSGTDICTGLKCDEHQVRFRSPGRSLSIPWSQVRRIERYTPPDRNRATRYIYITRRDRPPANRSTVDEVTFQLQDRPGLLESLRETWAGMSPGGALPLRSSG